MAVRQLARGNSDTFAILLPDRLLATPKLRSSAGDAQGLAFDVIESCCGFDAVLQRGEPIPLFASPTGVCAFRRTPARDNQSKEVNDVGTRLEQVSYRAR
jgi:hypothetical protein